MSAWEILGRLLLAGAVLAVAAVVVVDTVRAARRDVTRYRAVRAEGNRVRAELEAEIATARAAVQRERERPR